VQKGKAKEFRALHEGEPFVIPNPWDAGSAKVLAHLGFKALATTSGGMAFTLGKLDGAVTLDEVVEHTRVLAEATELPVSVDLENGHGHSPEEAALAITRAAEAGAVGGSIEDWDREGAMYELDHATERIAAAREAADATGFPFTLTARAENFLRGNPSVDDTIRRLQAFEKAGADVLMAPGLPDLAAVRAVCSALSKPFNFMVGIRGKSFTVAELEAAGVRRISLATSLYRTAMSGLLAAAREVQDKGTFGYLDQALATPDLNAFMRS
jgi:2-methylisocitrate lyase-like PEP mutase family enzyme